MDAKVIQEIRNETVEILVLQLSDGYLERNTYSETTGKLIKQDITYSNGIREVEQWADN